MLRGAAYFMLVFAVGFALGVVRVLWLVPLVGERAAELAEMPVMLVAIFYAARFVTRRFPASRERDLIISGGLALGVLLAVEFSVVLWLRGLSINQYLAERDPVAGTVYYVMLLVFAAMPWAVGRKHVVT
ncbi:MAG: hypothetical protein V2J12_02605 [Gammaproteobacteria bacterium]|jgi:hypothetical protein|nr:hypothetical protein [Gammaproteobacteria bacterium]